MEEDKVKKLAETLKKQGLAVSMYEAVEKAKSILTVGVEKNQGQEDKQDIPTQDSNKEEDGISENEFKVQNEDSTLNELMQGAGVDTNQVESQEKREENPDAKESGEVKEDIKEVFTNVDEGTNNSDRESGLEVKELNKEEIEDVGKNKEEEESKQKDENKIDLTKIFGYKK